MSLAENSKLVATSLFQLPTSKSLLELQRIKVVGCIDLMLLHPIAILAGCVAKKDLQQGGREEIFLYAAQWRSCPRPFTFDYSLQKGLIQHALLRMRASVDRFNSLLIGQ